MYYLMESLRNKVHNFDNSEYIERLNRNKDFYSFLMKVVNTKIVD